MEGVEIETKGENTAGNSEEPEKLLPSGTEPPPKVVPPPQDLLHAGNAVVAAEEKKTPEEALEENLVERDLRETGLKEGLPRGADAPSKIDAPSEVDGNGLPKIHTYAGDMSAEIQKRGSTISSIISAEKIKEPGVPEPQKNNSRTLLFIGGALLLIVIGAGAIFAAFFFTGQTAPTPVATQTIIPVNSSVTVFDNGTAPLATLLANARSSAQINLGDIEAINIATGTAPESAEEILTNLGAPNELARNATSVLVGLHAFDQVQPFLIVSVSAYDVAFAGMLSWEQTMGTGLGTFFAPSGAPEGITSHPPTLSFTDGESNNLDIRQSQSSWPILYTFPDQNLLIITTNESTLKEILTRLTLQNASNQ